jgi:hypothetical protein
MERIAVIARLKPGAARRAHELITEGPPFDPAELGCRAHAVYISDDELVFVFEGGEPVPMVTSAVRELRPEIFAAWEPLIEGIPRLAHPVYEWHRREPAGVVGS